MHVKLVAPLELYKDFGQLDDGSRGPSMPPIWHAQYVWNTYILTPYFPFSGIWYSMEGYRQTHRGGGGPQENIRCIQKSDRCTGK